MKQGRALGGWRMGCMAEFSAHAACMLPPWQHSPPACALACAAHNVMRPAHSAGVERHVGQALLGTVDRRGMHFPTRSHGMRA